MKIALVTAYFYPTSNGGTEKYVLNLARNLIAQNHDVDVLTAGTKEVIRSYQGLKIYEITDELSYESDILAGKRASANLNEFIQILKNNNYDLVHFHTLTPTFNTFHILETNKCLEVEIHFTAHIPGITCLHGDLMQFGERACDGIIKKQRCTACYISKKGFNQPLSNILAKSVKIFNYPRNIANVVEQKIEDLKRLNNLCDKIFLFTNWQKDIFILNGFDETKIEVTNQLLNKVLIAHETTKRVIKNIGFVGRISHEKGLHILIDAFKQANRKDLTLHIAGIINDEQYFEKLRSKTKEDTNIHWQLDLDEQEIDFFYRQIDTLVIPSIWLETGPFVLYEAFEKNIPVIANDLGDMRIWKNKGFDIKLYYSGTNLKNYLIQL
ncbi:glycosyltransferase [Pedobacter aquatilis]|uniref:glycosyltransferase n=1 Tax=Pedobacter aquatilis TaxID=351343 RepID=UPI00292F9CD0|nr:glycosyltransferase [Pedobacter aquatilis]